jgi:hypothetical protein
LKLKAEVSELVTQVQTLTRLVSKLTEQAFPSVERAVKKTNRRGPNPKYSKDILTERNMFVKLFEASWLEIEPLCGRWAPDGLRLSVKPDMDSMQQTFLRLSAELSGSEVGGYAAKALDRIDFIKTFLNNPKMRRCFSGNPQRAENRSGGSPRQLANALAGVPQIGLWRSLAVCGARPNRCTLPPQEQALPSYLRRAHPLLARAAKTKLGLPFFIDFMKRYRRCNDPMISQLKPADVQRLLSNVY